MERNSSEIIAGISTKANQVVGGAVEPILIILSTSLMLSMMTLTLVLINPLISLSLICFLLIYAICIGLTRYTLLKNSKKISRQSNKVIKVLQEGLGGIRDVLIDGSQDVYCKTFRKAESIRKASIRK